MSGKRRTRPLYWPRSSWARRSGKTDHHRPDEFKRLCAQLAEEHGFKINNPELRQEIVRGPSESQPVPVIPAGMPSPSMAYQLHRADILNRIEVRNASQLDWMIAVRMRVTGHDQQAVTQALMENASQEREAENRNWANYAERTAEAVFGPRGNRECARSEQRAEAWARVEGRDLAHERQVQHIQPRKIPERRRETLRLNEIAQAVASCASAEQNQQNRMPNTVRYVSCNEEDAQRRLLQRLGFPSGKAILR